MLNHKYNKWRPFVKFDGPINRLEIKVYTSRISGMVSEWQYQKYWATKHGHVSGLMFVSNTIRAQHVPDSWRIGIWLVWLYINTKLPCSSRIQPESSVFKLRSMRNEWLHDRFTLYYFILFHTNFFRYNLVNF